MAKIINKEQMTKLMASKYPKDRFDVAVNKAKKDLFVTILGRQTSKKKKYLVQNKLTEGL